MKNKTTIEMSTRKIANMQRKIHEICGKKKIHTNNERLELGLRIRVMNELRVG